ncbi:V-type ATP synthase subunit D [Angelakisella massiliensis]|uniref:V-type ATP synthase subunit D n=1 Tax=Angelakisella massiliensis TaxID=1871018 RepID=UPI0008F93D48|nr:V-type ATP synthase subunit D [Angelakisella massiliensis]
MAILQVNPTRMELSRLKTRLKTSTRGHKLLKDKRDDLMKKFLELVRRNKELREEVEKKIMGVYDGFAIASAVMSPEMLEEALMLPKEQVELEVGSANMMSVDVPVFKFTQSAGGEGDIYPYGLVSTSGELDDSVAALKEVLPALLELAQMEKSAQLLAEEIEKTRRRVNALEYVQIPSLQETIKSITMKLDENERGNLARLMKIKDMMVAQQRQAHGQ